MAAIDTSLAGPQTLNLLAKRNWASQEAGVIVVFCIVFIALYRSRRGPHFALDSQDFEEAQSSAAKLLNAIEALRCTS
ncbi:hypothetical protein PCL_08748 [Purpureocillium lilacinum]|uniref:Uncharacterized protein n=1 Tax=Purpureocillium lilacinum TaxID=33203 RepID=A0A2U3EG81_PURLI|nr:hypothetical protein PCL_08748 [Purpureocillium lilacinum]